MATIVPIPSANVGPIGPATSGGIGARGFTFSMPSIKINKNAFNPVRLIGLCMIELDNTLFRLRRAVAKGKNAHDEPIKASYSWRYLLAMKQGRVHNNGVRKPYTETVNLTISGHMLGSMQVVKQSSGKIGAQIYFNNFETAEIAASLHSRGFKGWFEYGQKDLKRIDKAVDVEIKKMLKDLIK